MNHTIQQNSIAEIGLSDYGLIGDGLVGSGLASPHKFNAEILYVWILSSPDPQPEFKRGIWYGASVWDSSAVWYG